MAINNNNNNKNNNTDNYNKKSDQLYAYSPMSISLI